MLENVIFLFIHILKIAISARRSVIMHPTSAFVILLCWHLTLILSNFWWWGCARFIFFLRRRVLSLHYWFLKAVQLYSA